jgi:disulfide bond formation protein DsbB
MAVSFLSCRQARLIMTGCRAPGASAVTLNGKPSEGMGMSNNTLYLKREKRFLVLLGLICLALIGGALYMQVVLAEAPCPLCILQRYALLLVAIFAFIGAAMPGSRSVTLFESLVVLSALGGIAAAGNHAWILAHPSESCGIDVLQPIVDGLPLANLLPMVFQVSGFCTTPYPPILGLSLAQWALVAFVLTAVLVPLGVIRNRRKPRGLQGL